MAAHLWKRPDRGSYYLVEGEYCRSLKTRSKGEAEFKLREYIKGKFKPGRQVTVREYYETWIETKREPIVRKSAIRDYRQHFTTSILGHFGQVRLQELSVRHLHDARNKMLSSGLGPKTCRNIIDATFRAMWRDAMEADVVQHNPFALLKWPRRAKSRPDPFAPEERAKILAYCANTDGFYYPWLLTLFYTGMRPSEASALRWGDVCMDTATISISKSRYMGSEGLTKTAGSDRTIGVYDFVVTALRALKSANFGSDYVFINKYGRPINAKKWGEHYWRELVDGAKVRYRKFYATRHTFITEMVRSKRNLKEIADYCGTSVAMIEQNYCGRLSLSLPPTVFQPPAIRPHGNQLDNMVAGPGFEFVPGSATKWEDSLSSQKIKNGRKRRSA